MNEKLYIEELKHKALEQCREKNHEMKGWMEYGWSHTAVCVYCGYQVVISDLAVNKSISGRAIEKKCRRN